MNLKLCEFDTLDMALTLPIKSHIVEPFKKAEVLDNLGPGDFIQIIREDLEYGYPFHAGDMITFYLTQTYEIAKEYPVKFSNTGFFQRQVFRLPREPGEYAIVYTKGDAYIYNQDIGYEAFDSGSVIVIANADSSGINLGEVQYGILVSGPVGTPTEFDIEPPENDISKIIDGKEETFWVHHILLSEKQSEVLSRIRLTYDGVRAINYIELDPVASYPFDIKGISYLDPNGIEVDLQVMVEKFSRRIRISFEEIKTRGFVLYFKIVSYEYSVFKLSDIPILDYIARGYRELNGSTLPDLNTLLGNARGSATIVGASSTSPEIITYYHYAIGINEATSGLKKFEPEGVYLSAPKKIDSIGLIGLESIEIGNPVRENSLHSSPLNLRGSFEYYLIKRDFEKETGRIIAVTYIPVCPMDTGEYIERLYPKDGNILKTSFRAHGLADHAELGNSFEEIRATVCGLKLYKNGVLLSRGRTSSKSGDYYITNNLTGYDEDPYTKLILNNVDNIKAADSLGSEIYEAVYTPWHSTIVSWKVTRVGDLISVYPFIGNTGISYNSDHSVLVPWFSGGNNISSELTLKIIIRNNSYQLSAGAENITHPDLTPKVKSFKLGFGLVNPETRFNSL